MSRSITGLAWLLATPALSCVQACHEVPTQYEQSLSGGYSSDPSPGSPARDEADASTAPDSEIDAGLKPDAMMPPPYMEKDAAPENDAQTVSEPDAAEPDAGKEQPGGGAGDGDSVGDGDGDAVGDGDGDAAGDGDGDAAGDGDGDAAGDGDGDGDGDPRGPLEPATFTRVFELFQSSCRSCHSSNSQFGLNMGTKASAFDELVGGPSQGAPEFVSCVDMGLFRVIPFKPDESLLIQKLEDTQPCGSEMPPGDPLSATEIREVRSWIAAGALNN